MIPLYYFRYPRLHFRPGGYVGVLGVQADPAYLMKEVVGPEEYPFENWAVVEDAGQDLRTCSH